jgi:ABC-type nitrate/sulfonate/bicarbonate transport system permease component
MDVLRFLKTILFRYYSIFLVLAAWEGIARSGGVNPVLLPPVSNIAFRFVHLILFDKLISHTGQTMFRMWTGLALATLIGIPLGMMMARFKTVHSLLGSPVNLAFPIPKIGIYPILIILFGVLHLSKIMLIFIECTFPIVTATCSGALLVDRRMIWSAESMGTREGRILWKIIFPSALPHIFMGFRIALIVSLIVVFLSEMMASADGLGHLMMASSRVFRSADMFVAIGVISFLGLAFDGTLLALRRRLLKWHVEGELD